MRYRALCVLLVTCVAGSAAYVQPATDGSPVSQKVAARVVAEVVRTALPREVERSDDWGRTKRVTTGVRVTGKPFWPQFRRRKKEVRHGVWKRYRVRMVEPEEELDVRVEQLRPLDDDTYACTLVVDAKLDGWAQTRVFNRGVHVVTLTAESESRVRLAIQCEVTLRLSLSDATLTADPRVTSAKLDLDDFRLRRLSKLHGDAASELGKGLKKIAEEMLDGPKLTAKLNRVIDKKRDRLTVPLAPSFGG